MPASRKCAAASECSRSRGYPYSRRFSRRRWPGLKRQQARSKPRWKPWIMRSPRLSGPISVGMKLKCTASAAKSCSNATPLARPLQKIIAIGDCDCATPEGAKLRTARYAFAGQALSVDRPSRRRPRDSHRRPRRFCADAGISGDCRGARSAGRVEGPRAARGRRTGSSRRRSSTGRRISPISPMRTPMIPPLAVAARQRTDRPPGRPRLFRTESASVSAGWSRPANAGPSRNASATEAHAAGGQEKRITGVSPNRFHVRDIQTDDLSLDRVNLFWRLSLRFMALEMLGRCRQYRRSP